MSPSTPLDPSHLTVHEDFLQRLARSLLADTHEAKDVVQEAFLAALRQQPDTAGSLRPWLSRVVRNHALLAKRGRGRRSRREAIVAREDVEPSTADLLAKEEVRRKIVAAVVALPEPYQRVVLLRYMEDLPPREIARRMDVPVETVRTQVARGRARLRELLDAQAGGTRRAGLALLAPWLVSTGAAEAGAAAGTALSLAAKIGLAVGAAAVAAGLILWRPWTPDERPPVHAPAPETAKTPEPVVAPTLKGAGGTTEAAASIARAAGHHTPTYGPPSTMRGRVTVHQGTTQAIRILVWPVRIRSAFDHKEPRLRPATALRQVDADPHGYFTIEDLPAGPYVVQARKEGHLPARGIVMSGPGAPVGLLKMSRRNRGGAGEDAASFEVRVVDAAGEPVAGAQVECAYLTGVPPKLAVSNADGKVTFSDVPYARADAGGGWAGQQQELAFGYVTARKGGLVGTAPYNVWCHIPSHEVGPLVLDKPAQVQGALKGVASFAGLRVRATRWVGKSGMSSFRGSRSVVVSDEAAVDAEGRYAFSDLAPGTYYLTLVSPDGLRIHRRDEKLGSHVVQRKPPGVGVPVTPPVPPGGKRRRPRSRPPPRTSWSPVKVVLKPGQSLTRDLAVIPGVTLRGELRTASGRARVKGARVTVEFAPFKRMGWREFTPGGAPAELLGNLWPDTLRNTMSWQSVRTDAEGRYVVRGLAPGGKYFVRVEPHAGWSFDQRYVEMGEADSTFPLVHDVDRAGSVQLYVRGGTTYSLRRAGEQEDAFAFKPPWSDIGVVHVPGLRQGTWELWSAMGQQSRTSYVITSFEITAGAQAEVSALRAGNCRVAGRVLEGGNPVEGALAWIPNLGGAQARTDAEGRFEFLFPSNMVWMGLALTILPPDPDRVSVSVLLTRRWPHQAPDGPDARYFEWEGDIALPDRVLKISVVDETGAPIGGARVSFHGDRMAADGQPRPSYWSGTVDDNGQATVPGLQPDVYRVHCTLPSGMAMRKTVETTERETRVEFRASPPGVVRVRVVNGDGEPMVKTHVAGMFFDPGTKPEGEGHERFRAAREVKGGGRTDDKGEVTFEKLPPGLLVVYVSAHRKDFYGQAAVAPGEERILDLVVERP